MSNTWVTYPVDRDNWPKGPLIPDKTTGALAPEVKVGLSTMQALLRMGPRTIS